MQKNAKRRGPTQKEREVAFLADMKKIFNVSHQNQKALIKIPEDREFQQAQLGEAWATSSMASVDIWLAQKEKVKMEREAGEKECREMRLRGKWTCRDLSQNSRNRAAQTKGQTACLTR